MINWYMVIFFFLFIAGLQCEAEIDECLSDPCNPEGTERCLDLDNKFGCVCNAGYSGELCEVRYCYFPL